jgi:hypothetical protein
MRERDLALDDQVRAADVEVVAAAALQVLELPAGLVLGVDPEADAGEIVDQLLVELASLLAARSARC